MLNYNFQKQQIDRVLAFFSRYDSSRPKPDRNLDQFWATEETVLKRVQILGNIENISQKRILFLGDDDLTSLVFSMFYKAGKITVVDIDHRLLGFLKDTAEAENFSIEFFKHDLRNPLKKDRFKKYDIIFFDPPYTPQAANIWLTRAIESSLGSGSNKLRKNPDVLSSKLYFMCYGYTDRSTERGLKIQQLISSLGLIIQEKARGFNKYYGAESLGSASDLYLVQPTPRVNIKQIDITRGLFYTGKKRK